MRHGDGHYIWIEATTRGVYNEHGEVQHVISVSRDVSERKGHELTMKTARRAGRERNRAKSTFLANMSHELRTPLNAIIGFADIMREQMLGPVDNPRYREYVGLIHQSGQLLLDLITDILDMAKIEAGKLDLHLEQVDAGATIAECTRLLAERAAAKGVELAAELPQAPLLLAADRRALLQIMLNLASNAVKFTPEGGSVILGAERTLGGLCISVRDKPASASRRKTCRGWDGRSSRSAPIPRSPRAARGWAGAGQRAGGEARRHDEDRQRARHRHHGDGDAAGGARGRGGGLKRKSKNHHHGRPPSRHGEFLLRAFSYSAATRTGRWKCLPYSSRAMVRQWTSSGPSARRSVRWLA